LLIAWPAVSRLLAAPACAKANRLGWSLAGATHNASQS